MMRKTLYFVFTFLFFTLIFACSKDSENENFDYVNAIVIDSGEIAADGCGWVIEISDNTLKPINLKEAFMINNLEVKLIFDPLESEFSCGFGLPIKEISIKEIRLR